MVKVPPGIPVVRPSVSGPLKLAPDTVAGYREATRGARAGRVPADAPGRRHRREPGRRLPAVPGRGRRPARRPEDRRLLPRPGLLAPDRGRPPGHPRRRRHRPGARRPAAGQRRHADQRRDLPPVRRGHRRDRRRAGLLRQHDRGRRRQQVAQRQGGPQAGPQGVRAQGHQAQPLDLQPAPRGPPGQRRSAGSRGPGPESRSRCANADFAAPEQTIMCQRPMAAWDPAQIDADQRVARPDQSLLRDPPGRGDGGRPRPTPTWSRPAA